MLKRKISILVLIIGVFLVLQILIPIISFEVWEHIQIANNQKLETPIGIADNSINFVWDEATADTSSDSLGLPDHTVFKSFYLTIPKIGLNSIKVEVNSRNFDQQLAHLPDTALPGERGNVFVVGHSAADIWVPFSKKIAYFAHLQYLKKGDHILLSVGNQTFKYRVIGFKIVNPDDLSVIQPLDKEGRYLSLMTCVPPGLNTKRLLVIAKI